MRDGGRSPYPDAAHGAPLERRKKKVRKKKRKREEGRRRGKSASP